MVGWSPWREGCESASSSAMGCVFGDGASPVEVDGSATGSLEGEACLPAWELEGISE